MASLKQRATVVADAEAALNAKQQEVATQAEALARVRKEQSDRMASIETAEAMCVVQPPAGFVRGLTHTRRVLAR